MKQYKIKDSSHTNGQAASVSGDNVDAIQDSVNYGQQTQVGVTDTTQEQNIETEEYSISSC